MNLCILSRLPPVYDFFFLRFLRLRVFFYSEFMWRIRVFFWLNEDCKIMIFISIAYTTKLECLLFYVRFNIAATPQTQFTYILNLKSFFMFSYLKEKERLSYVKNISLIKILESFMLMCVHKLYSWLNILWCQHTNMSKKKNFVLIYVGKKGDANRFFSGIKIL